MNSTDLLTRMQCFIHNMEIKIPPIRSRMLFAVSSSPSSLLDANNEHSSDKKLNTQIFSVSRPQNNTVHLGRVFTDPHSLKAHASPSPLKIQVTFPLIFLLVNSQPICNNCPNSNKIMFIHKKH